MTKSSDRGASKKALLKKVEAAYLQIAKGGVRPTVAAIRDIVGGSYSTICPAVSTVKEKLEAERKQAEAIPDMPDEVKEIFDATWQHVYRLSNENSVAAQKSFAADLERKEAEISEREGVIKDLEKEIETLKQEMIDTRQSEHDAQLDASEQHRLRQNAENELSIMNAKLEERDLVLSRLLPHPGKQARSGEKPDARNPK